MYVYKTIIDDHDEENGIQKDQEKGQKEMHPFRLDVGKRTFQNAFDGHLLIAF